MKTVFSRWRKAAEGTTAIEYALIAAVISLSIAVAVYTMGDTLNELFAPLAGLLTR